MTRHGYAPGNGVFYKLEQIPFGHYKLITIDSGLRRWAQIRKTRQDPTAGEALLPLEKIRRPIFCV